jgi:hypothetical protein
MDYILQTEKILKFLEFNIELEESKAILKLKKIFNNDLNLLGGYIKDFLTIKNDGNISNDNHLYNDFVLCFEKSKNKSAFIYKLTTFANHYISLVYEDTEDRILLSTIASVNSCFAIEYYPFLMELIDKKLNNKIDRISYALMLQSISDKVFKNFESEKENNITLADLRKELESIRFSRNERIAI